MAITVDVRGLPETKALLDQFQGSKLNARMRRSLRRAAKVFREGMRAEASGRSDLPRTFRKTRTRAHRNPLGVSVSPKSPLSSIFEHGASIHVIESKTGGPLANKQLGFFSRHGVYHPGMAARPFVGPVFDRYEDDAGDAAQDELFEGIR